MKEIKERKFFSKLERFEAVRKRKREEKPFGFSLRHYEGLTTYLLKNGYEVREYDFFHLFYQVKIIMSDRVCKECRRLSWRCECWKRKI